MARESKRKRDERRFGASELLADLVVGTPVEDWSAPPIAKTPAGIEALRSAQSAVADSVVIVADNVARYYYDHDQVEWTYKEDFPCVAPPFPSFFLEFAIPSAMNMGGKIVPSGPNPPRRVGWIVDAIKAEGRPYPKPRVAGYQVGGGYDVIRLPDDSWYFRAMLLADIGLGAPCYTPLMKYFATDSSGAVVEDPSTILSMELGLTPDEMVGLAREVDQFLPALFLAICFMNCKNVVISAVAADARVDRERRKAGLKPFVRHHTIDIEPMKEVIRAEGGVESVGLRRALHIVRGHFVRRKIPNEVTYWRSAHTRGSLASGVVASSYRVHPPTSERE